MKLAHGTEIKFDSTTGTITHFVVILDGEPTIDILCDMADTEKVIRIARHITHGGGLLQDTRGRFTTYTKLLEDVDGAPMGTEERVDRKSVYRYILPRLHIMLGRLLRAAN
jgi:hypothetical protein